MKKLKMLVSAGLCMAMMFTFTACGNPYSDVNFDDYIKVAKYKGVTLEPVKVKVTDKDVETEIDARRKAKKTVKDVKEGVVKDGDTINIDYVGSIDGVKFDGGAEEGRDLTIGSGEFIKGFESSLVGAKVGATKNIKVKFPDNYSEEDLAGKNAVFAVKINSKQEENIPKLDEKFVKENSDVKTVKEYKTLVKKELEKKQKAEKQEAQRSDIWTQIVTDSTMKKDKDKKDKYPTEELERVEEESTAFYQEIAKKNNMSFEDFTTQNFGLDEKKFNKQLAELAKMTVKDELVLYYIAEKEDISVSGKEFDEYIENTLRKFGYTEESYEEANNGKSYEKVVGEDVIKQAALKEKVQKFIVDNGKVKETKKKK